MAGTVQIKGLDNTMEAFENRGVECWSVWQHKQFLSKGKGATELQKFLEMLMDGATNAIYTFKVYEDIDDPKFIKEKTECDGSINFRLNGEAQEMGGTQLGMMRYNNTTHDRLNKIEEKLDQLTTPAADDGPQTIGSFFTSLIKSPEDLINLINAGKSLMGIKTDPIPIMPQMHRENASMGNATTTMERTEEQLQQMSRAIDILEKNDPNLADHLVKLADLSEKDPGQFNFLLKMLEGL